MQPIELIEIPKVGNSAIDKEHELFSEVMNRIISSIEKNDPPDYLESLVNELIKYAEFHFLSEQNMMRRFDYPDFLQHMNEHDKLLAELRNRIFSLDYEYMDFSGLVEYFIGWFKNHIRNTDKKLVEFLREKDYVK